MCGLAGIVSFDGGNPDRLKEIASKMAGELFHRGPDGVGIWGDKGGFAALGFRRLSIIDLSETGHQPMISQDGRYALVYNGEVYNFAELRSELLLKGHRFNGSSDSEVVLSACQQWGVIEACKRFNGMFALAFWDSLERKIYLARDRMGVKPLYWGKFGKRTVFASELKALRKVPWMPVELNLEATCAYFRYGYYPAPTTVYKGIKKIMPGQVLEISETNETATQFWSLAEVASRGVENSFNGDEHDAVAELDRLLRQSVSSRMVADVPVGAFLSAGIDSSTVVAMMKMSSNSETVKSFTIGFEQTEYDESVRAREIASHLKTDHHELIVLEKDVIDIIPNLSLWYDEPFADSSQIPTALVSQLARSHVKVSLSGDGGDELFYGYDRYFAGAGLSNQLSRIPEPFRRILSKLIEGASDRQLSALLKVLPAGMRPNRGVEAMRWFAGPLGMNATEIYRQMISLWVNPAAVMNGTVEGHGTGWENVPDNIGTKMHNLMPYLDGMTYLPDDILTKVDRASMAFGLEAREPLLDYRLVEFAWALPHSMKSRDGTGKWLLREVLKNYVPTELTNQPKMGFALPIGGWLRGPLRDWAESLLFDVSSDDGLLEKSIIESTWRGHIEGNVGLEAQIWTILMFRSWHQRWFAAT